MISCRKESGMYVGTQQIVSAIFMLILISLLKSVYNKKKCTIKWWVFLSFLEWQIFKVRCICVCVNPSVHLDNLLFILTSNL